jgi:hypothetical protein
VQHDRTGGTHLTESLTHKEERRSEREENSNDASWAKQCEARVDEVSDVRAA